MRRFSLPIALVMVLVAGVALAVKPDVNSLTITPVAAGAASGSFRLQEMKNGDVRIQGHLDNLPAGETFTSTWSLASSGCLGVAGTPIEGTYTSNKQGKANFNAIIPGPVNVLDIVEIQVVQGAALVACAN